MKLAEFSVKNYQFTIIIFLMVLALGISSLLNMPRGEDPPFNAPMYVVVAIYPGTSPNDMEKLVVDPIEERLNELTKLKRIRTNIDDGLAVLQVEFQWGEDIDNKYNEVVREITALRGSLPPDMMSLEVRKISSSDVNTRQMALVSDKASYLRLKTEGDKLKKNLETVSGVKKVKLHGLPDREVQISIALEKLAQLHLPLNQVIGAIQSEAANIPGGSLESGMKRYNVKTSGDFSSLDDIRNTIIRSGPSAVTYLKDVADVSLTDKTQQYLTRYNGKRAIFITMNEKDRTNILDIQQQVQPMVDQFKKQLPADIQLEEGFVQAEDVGIRLGHFSRDFLIAILLVLVTLLPLGTRASLVVMISIPLSISIGLFVLDTLNYTINQLSIVGMVIALGLLVDDSIVVVENIERFLRMGYSRKEAAIQATNQISLAVLGCTATLIVAFLPLLFLPEGSGDFIRSLPMAVVTTVLASLFVSLTIVPFLSSLLLKKHENAEGNLFLQFLQRLISGSYRRLLHRALAYPKTTLTLASLLFIGSLMLFKVVGFSLFPKSEKPMFLVNIQLPLGSALPATDRVAKMVEQEILKMPDVKSVFTNVGKGNPEVYYNENSKDETSHYAQLFVRLNDMPLPEIEARVAKLREKFLNHPEARIEVKQFEQGPPIEAPIAIRVFGENLDSLRALAGRVTEVLKQTPGTLYIDNPLRTYKTDLKVDINREKAAMLGIPTAEIDRSVRLGLAGLQVANYKDQTDENRAVSLKVPTTGRPTVDAFDKVYISSMSGALVPLSQLTRLKFESSVPTINHYNKNRYVTVTSYVQQGYNTQEVTGEVLQQLDKMTMPSGFKLEAAGEVESSKESFGGLGTIILITVFGFLAILLLEFGTFKSTLIVLSVIPLGIIGAVLALLFTGNTLSFVAVVGIIALAGIEVKNSILLVDYTNLLRSQGKGLDEAIEEAGETRFLPIILTTMTAIGGLIPLVLENNPLYSPLAWVLIGGLIVSTLLTRLVTPVMYRMLAPKV